MSVDDKVMQLLQLIILLTEDRSIAQQKEIHKKLSEKLKEG